MAMSDKLSNSDEDRTPVCSPTVDELREELVEKGLDLDDSKEMLVSRFECARKEDGNDYE